MATLKPSWDEIWMSLAQNISQRSYDPRLQVGSVIVSMDNEAVLSVGYNGNAHKEPNVPDSLEPGKSGFIHSEINSLIKMNYNDPRPRKIYLTHSPCETCARSIINGKITKVIYLEEYRSTKGLDILRERGIMVEKFNAWE